MSKEQPRNTTNYVRRVLGVLLALLPFALLLASLIIGITDSEQPTFAAVGLMIAAAIFAALNFYLSFIRPQLFSLRCGSMDGYLHVSGFPIIGTILLIIGAIVGFGAIGSSHIGMGAYVLDTGGPAWFVLSTWRDRSFWDD